MKFDFGTLICMVSAIVSLSLAMDSISKVLKVKRFLKEASLNNEVIVKGNNELYNVTNGIFVVVTEASLLFLLLLFVSTYKVAADIVVSSVIIFISVGVCILINVISMFKDKDVFLTKKGLICFSKIFKFSECRFSWDSSETSAEISKTLHIYEKDMKVPYIVSFDSNTELAHKIVSENSKSGIADTDPER